MTRRTLRAFCKRRRQSRCLILRKPTWYAENDARDYLHTSEQRRTSEGHIARIPRRALPEVLSRKRNRDAGAFSGGGSFRQDSRPSGTLARSSVLRQPQRA